MLEGKLDGTRKRLWSERKRVEEIEADGEGNPLHAGVTVPTRQRIMREIMSWLSRCPTDTVKSVARRNHFADHVEVKLGERLRTKTSCMHVDHSDMTTDEFLDVLELAANYMWLARRMPSNIDEINSLLADDRSRYRLRNVGTVQVANYEVQHIDNKHLHTEVVDRTFELTSLAEFASAGRDYAEAWKHYSRGDLDDAVTNAAKAVESACKVAVSRIDPKADVADSKLGTLIVRMMELDIIPSQLQTVASALSTIFQNSGVLRNRPGVAHGSLGLESPEATTALLALRMSGSLVSFLAARVDQSDGSERT